MKRLKLTLLSVVLCALPAVASAGENPAWWDPLRAPVWATTATTTRWLFPLMPSKRHEESGFRSLLRIINDSDREGRVQITGWDDTGEEYGPRTLHLRPRQSVNLTASQLEAGDRGAFPVGLGNGEGWWRLELESSLEFRAGVWSRIGESLASLGAGTRIITNTPLLPERASVCTEPGTWGAIAYGFRDRNCGVESVAWFFATDEAESIEAHNGALAQCLEEGISDCRTGLVHQCGAVAYGRSENEQDCILTFSTGATIESAEDAATSDCYALAPTGRRCEIPERAASIPSGGEAPRLDALEVLPSPTQR